LRYSRQTAAVLIRDERVEKPFPDYAGRNFRTAFFKNTRALIVGNEFHRQAARSRRQRLSCGGIAASKLLNNMLRVAWNFRVEMSRQNAARHEIFFERVAPKTAVT